MLLYFFIFAGIGVATAHFTSTQKQALIIILMISILWGLSHRVIWGFVALGELFLGYFAYGLVTDAKKAVQMTA